MEPLIDIVPQDEDEARLRKINHNFRALFSAANSASSRSYVAATNEASAAQQAASKEMAQLRDHFDDVQSSLNGQIKTLSESLNALETKVDALSNLELKVDAMESRLAALEASLSQR